MCWNKEAEEAMKRRAEKNVPWPEKHKCKNCGKPYSSDTNYAVCPDCVRLAYDVLT